MHINSNTAFGTKGVTFLKPPKKRTMCTLKQNTCQQISRLFIDPHSMIRADRVVGRLVYVPGNLCYSTTFENKLQFALLYKLLAWKTNKNVISDTSKQMLRNLWLNLKNCSLEEDGWRPKLVRTMSKLIIWWFDIRHSSLHLYLHWLTQKTRSTRPGFNKCRTVILVMLITHSWTWFWCY